MGKKKRAGRKRAALVIPTFLAGIGATEDGLVQEDVDAHADRILQQAAICTGVGIEIFAWDIRRGMLAGRVRIWLDPDGSLVFSPLGAGNLFGAELIQSLERKGAGDRVRVYRSGGAA